MISLCYGKREKERRKHQQTEGGCEKPQPRTHEAHAEKDGHLEEKQVKPSR